MEQPSLRIEEAKFNLPTRCSYNFKLKLSDTCRPYGILIVENRVGTIRFSECFYMNTIQAADENGWIEVSVQIRGNINPIDYDFRCYLFEQSNQIVTATDSPSSLTPVEPETDPEGNRAPSPIYLVNPKTPAEVEKQGKEVWGIIEAVVDEEGNVVRAKVLETDNRKFGREAMLAMKSTRFYPALVKGKPTPVKIRLPYQYSPY